MDERPRPYGSYLLWIVAALAAVDALSFLAQAKSAIHQIPGLCDLRGRRCPGHRWGAPLRALLGQARYVEGPASGRG